jgi:predicted RNA binding protein YcfA (HicA-like mRNA interferase family)
MKAVPGREFARLLEQRGWILLRVRGSHYSYMREGVPERITIPIHGNQPLKIGLQRRFMKVAGITEDEL